MATLSLFYRYYLGICSSELAELVPLTLYRRSSTHYSDRLHDFSVTIPRCYKDVYINSFFPCTAGLWNFLPVECFPLTYDLSGFKSRINSLELTLFHCRFLLNRLSVCCNLFVLHFLVIPCLIVAVQPCMEWIPVKKTYIVLFMVINILTDWYCMVKCFCYCSCIYSTL